MVSIIILSMLDDIVPLCGIYCMVITMLKVFQKYS